MEQYIKLRKLTKIIEKTDNRTILIVLVAFLTFVVALKYLGISCIGICP